MADAKYVVGDHRNGDAKIELDAKKKQFTGLTKEELMKYAEDPFWVRLRWFMFVLFWAMWLCMLAGAIYIIVKAPKCALPPPRTWYEKGPLVDTTTLENDYRSLAPNLNILTDSNVAGIFVSPCEDTYEVLDDPSCLEQFKQFIEKTRDAGIKVIVDLTANFVSKTHKWFELSENRSAEYSDYFIWAKGRNFDPDQTKPNPPNNWVSDLSTSMWTYSSKRKEFYLHHFSEDQPDLNFHNPEVVKQFDAVIKLWMQAGADGIRLQNARELLVNMSFPDERRAEGSNTDRSADHTDRAFWRHVHTADRPQLDGLLAHWAHLTVATVGREEPMFTIAESGVPELFLLQRNLSVLRPPSAAATSVADVSAALKKLNELVDRWPALQLVNEGSDEEGELAAFAMLLPAAPVLDFRQLPIHDNESTGSERLRHAVELRADAGVQHGRVQLAALPAHNSSQLVLACARWKRGHTGYVGVYNPGAAPVRADVAQLPHAPPALSLHRASRRTAAATNYTTNLAINASDVLVPAKSSLILSFVPKTAAEEQ